MSATLVGIGVGPGDPELMTMRALRELRAADRVVAPSLAVDAVGRAESIVREAAPEVRMERVVFAMGAGSRGDRAAATEAVAERLVAFLDDGEQVAFVTLGDPNVYSTFSSVAAAVIERRPDTTVRTVPGIMAFQELAARSGTVLLDEAETLTVVAALDGDAEVASALDRADRALVIYKGGRHLPAIAERLASAGRLGGAVMGELLGLPGQRVSPLADVADRPAGYLATVIVPPAAASPRPEPHVARTVIASPTDAESPSVESIESVEFPATDPLVHSPVGVESTSNRRQGADATQVGVGVSGRIRSGSGEADR